MQAAASSPQSVTSFSLLYLSLLSLFLSLTDIVLIKIIMDSRNLVTVAFSSILVLMLIGCARSDLNKDREQCANTLIGLATCLPYVGGDAKSPTLDCCTGLKQVLEKSKICLCILIKDRDDPQLGLKINATLALNLPDACHAPANISLCPTLLNLPANSPDAKIFEQHANNTKSSSPPTNATKGSSSDGNEKSTSAAINSDGGMGNKLLGMDKFCGISIWCLSTMYLLFKNV